jgi:HSP20 family protein
MKRSMFSPLFGLTPRDLFTASPFELMRRFSEDMDRLFEGVGPRWGPMSEESHIWSPPVEVSEQEGQFVVCAELPGLQKEDVKVELTPNGLVITGERKRDHEERREGFYRSERSYGKFSRTIPIPEEANLEEAKAQFENGILKVSLPIPESKRQRREIPIEAGAASTKAEQQGQGSRAALAGSFQPSAVSNRLCLVKTDLRGDGVWCSRSTTSEVS